MTRRLAEADVSRDDRLVDLATEHFPNLVDDLFGEVGPFVVHRHDDPVDRQVRVEPLANQTDRFHQLRDSFERQVLALDRDRKSVV